jgi:hypothetical protein
MNKTLTFAFDVELEEGEKILKGTKVVVTDKPKTNGCEKKQKILDRSESVIVPEYYCNGEIIKESFTAGFSKDCFIELH